MYAAYLFILRAFDAASGQAPTRQSDSEQDIADCRLVSAPQRRCESDPGTEPDNLRPGVRGQGSEGRWSANRDGKMPHASRTIHYSDTVAPGP